MIPTDYYRIESEYYRKESKELYTKLEKLRGVLRAYADSLSRGYVIDEGLVRASLKKILEKNT